MQIRDPILFYLFPDLERGKKSGSEMNIPDHFSVFWVKNTYSLMQNRSRDLSDPGSGMEKFESGIRYEHPGSATLPAGTVYFREKHPKSPEEPYQEISDPDEP